MTLKYFTEFTEDYEIIIKPGAELKGLLKINNITKNKIENIQISHTESGVCIALAKKSIDDWRYKDDWNALTDGWLSYENLANSVPKWKALKIEKEKDEESDYKVLAHPINETISRLNIKIRDYLILNNKKHLIINGKKIGKKGHYRFRVHPKLLKIEATP